MTIHPATCGRFFEDFVVGDVYQHPFGRTITEADNTWLTLLTMNTNQNHVNAHLASQNPITGGRVIVNSGLTIAIVGVAQAAYDAALRYARERTAFGQPIAEFQAIQLKLADIATQLQAARLMTYWAASQADSGKQVNMEASMAKYFASEVALAASLESMRIYGGGVRILHRVCGRATLSGRSADGDRRGDQRHSAHSHRQGAAGRLGNHRLTAV